MIYNPYNLESDINLLLTQAAVKKKDLYDNN